MKPIFAVPLTIAAGLCCSQIAGSVENKNLIPSGWSALNEGTARGDLNHDGRSDLALAVRRHNEIELLKAGKDATRRLLIFLRQPNGALKQVFTNRTAVLGHDDGGMLGDPFQSLRIERGVIVIDHWGGSREQWEYTSRFRLQGRQWRLIGLRSASRDRLTGDSEQRDTNLLTSEVEYSATANRKTTVRRFLELRAVAAGKSAPRLWLASGTTLRAHLIGTILVVTAEGINARAVLRLRDAAGRVVKPLSTSKQTTTQIARFSWKALKPRDDYNAFGPGMGEANGSAADAVADATLEIAYGSRVWKTSHGNYPAQIRFARRTEFVLPLAP